MFKAVQRAFETLSDSRKRQIYDSQDPFDDAIPSADSIKTDEEFFTILTPVFTRNAKHVRKLAPALRNG